MVSRYRVQIFKVNMEIKILKDDDDDDMTKMMMMWCIMLLSTLY